MSDSKEKHGVAVRTILKGVVILALVGGISFGFEHFGGRYMTELTDYVAAQGRLGPVIFMIVNAIAIMFLLPQSLFSVAAGVLFGWKFGTLYASIAMTSGAVGSFFIARYGVRDWLRERFKDHVVYRKMQSLSLTHPLHVISLSRLIPVIPFPLASYLLGITHVKSVPYGLLTWLCMLPETLFLASGGHLLHSGIVHGKTQWEVAAIVCAAAAVLAIAAHRMKKKFLESADD